MKRIEFMTQQTQRRLQQPWRCWWHI